MITTATYTRIMLGTKWRAVYYDGTKESVDSLITMMVDIGYPNGCVVVSAAEIRVYGEVLPIGCVCAAAIFEKQTTIMLLNDFNQLFQPPIL